MSKNWNYSLHFLQGKPFLGSSSFWGVPPCGGQQLSMALLSFPRRQTVQHSSRKDWHNSWKQIQPPFFNQIRQLFEELARPDLKHHIIKKKLHCNLKGQTLGILLPFVCPCAVFLPRRGDMRPACWKQSCDRVISRWSIKAWDLWTVPFQIPTQERSSMTWMFQSLRKPSPALTSGTMQNWLAFGKPRGFSKMCQIY